ncbi:peptidylprolyl isomerase [Altererythrobacter aurantiacus]|uniref:Peptidyl-prolyl cis-trans isomerase n=1 Tax=Parapontixanthobacter aurantiacus TaxID=1463599 RepID=A0A844ZDV3_9SPHN|nr:peptidylprolyl isomerase [Parapontixanthobacter aurantiacus]MXO85197.1 peptidylprolyl isomerase [Parapontixanthobacter aurantiacus]
MKTFIAALALSFPAFALGSAASAQIQDAVVTPEEQTVNYAAQINYNIAEDRDNILLLDLSNGERVAVRLMPQWAPNHVERIKTLTRQGFYDGVVFHRVIDGFMAQSGDPTGTGQGGSELPDLAEEFNPIPHVRGTISMARANEEDSANSQFFIVFYPRFSLDKRYTNFGRVISNMDAVDAINRGEPPANPTRILQASLASQNKPVPVRREVPAETITADDLSAPIES